MRWPWSTQVDAAREEAKHALEGQAHSERRRRESEEIGREAVQVTNVQWAELHRNGWTELLQEAWGGRRR